MFSPSESGEQSVPDANGKLSLDERNSVSDHVNEKAQHEGDPCPHCGDTNTSVAEDLFRLAVANSPIPRGYIPVVPVVCNNCGHIRLFSGQELGLTMPKAAEATPTEEGA